MMPALCQELPMVALDDLSERGFIPPLDEGGQQFAVPSKSNAPVLSHGR